MKRRDAAGHSAWIGNYARRWYEEFGEYPSWRSANFGEYQIRFHGQLLPDIFDAEELDDVEAMIVKVKAHLQQEVTP